MFAIVFKLVVAGHVFFMPSHSRFQYGAQCEEQLKRVLPRLAETAKDKKVARIVEASCEIQTDEVRS